MKKKKKKDTTIKTSQINANEKFFCYLFVNTLKTQKLTTFMDYSKNPFKSLADFNKTKNGIHNVYWKMGTIIGPFSDQKKCKIFCNMWKKKSRGIKSRKMRGILLTILYNIQNINDMKEIVNLENVPSILHCWDEDYATYHHIIHQIFKK